MALKQTEIALEEKYSFNKDNIVYVLDGDPIPLARVRFSKGRCWDSQKQVKLVSEITLEAQHGRRPAYTGALEMEVTFFCPIPPTRMKKNKPGDPHAVKPDLDNLLKYICDVAQNVLFENDSRVYKISCKKIYSNHPRTEFIIKTLENDEEI